jgi:hypothetical protein
MRMLIELGGHCGNPRGDLIENDEGRGDRARFRAYVALYLHDISQVKMNACPTPVGY